MAPVRNERKINSLLEQMNRQTGYDAVKEKAEVERLENERYSSLMKNLSQLEQQDPMRVAPMINENTREERMKEEERHRIRRNVMERVYNRQRSRGERTYS